jgi:hypothetical protein
MKTHFAARVTLGFAAGFALSTLLLEAALWLLPTYNGVYAADPDADWPVHHLVPNASYTYSTGWNFRNVRRGEINNMGYVAPFDYAPGSEATVIFGDSYIEGLMNRYEDTLPAQLATSGGADSAQLLNFGISGSALPDYLGLGTLIRDRFRPTWIIVFIGDGDFVEGFDVRPGHFRWSPDDVASVELMPDQLRSPLVKFVRRSALVRYLRANLRLNMHSLFDSRPATGDGPGVTFCPETHSERTDVERAKSYVAELPLALGVPAGRIIFLRDSETQRQAIYAPEAKRESAACPPSRDDEALESLLREAQRVGIKVVDTVPLFRKHYEATGERVDYSPTDWHWNATGHRLAADALRDLMEPSPAR